MLGVDSAIASLEEAIKPLKEQYGQPELGQLGIALKDTVEEKTPGHPADLLLKLHFAVRGVMSAVSYQEIGNRQISRPKGLSDALSSYDLMDYALVMSMSIKNLQGRIPRELLEQLLKQLIFDKYIPRRVTVDQLIEGYPTMPLFMAARSIRQRRRLRGGARSKKGQETGE